MLRRFFIAPMWAFAICVSIASAAAQDLNIQTELEILAPSVRTVSPSSGPNEGNTVVRSTGAQGSAILSSMAKANCFIVLPAECGNVAAGSLVEVQAFGSM